MTLRAMLVINFSQYVVLSLFINFPLYVVTRPELVSTLAGAAPISRELCKVKSYPEQQTLDTRHSQLAAKLQVTKLWRVAAGPFRAEPYHYLHHVTFTQNLRRICFVMLPSSLTTSSPTLPTSMSPSSCPPR